MGKGEEFSILVVDNEESNLHILNHILKTDYTVYAAKSGQSALKIASMKKPELILLDILMPGMSGFEVLAELKSREDTKNIPVIIITGLDRAEDEQRGLRLGAVDYITKPFNSATVKTRVETHLKLVKQMRMIERLGMLDALTEIPNRRSFDSQLSIEWGRAVREKTPLSLLMIDIDNFKAYNDTNGHLQGDALLKALAKIFVSSVKRATDMVFRWGGDEFAVILPNCGLDGALTVAEAIRANAEANPLSGKPIPVTVSIGAAEAADGDISAEGILSRADKALYDSKLNGRNKVRICRERF